VVGDEAMAADKFLSDKVLSKVLWVGGGYGTGTGIVAHALARRLGFTTYHVDAHERQHAMGARPRAGVLDPLPMPPGLDDWGQRPIEELIARVQHSVAERFPMIIDDLIRLAVSGPGVIVEGTALLPSLVKRYLPHPERAVWLLPARQVDWGDMRVPPPVPDGVRDDETALYRRDLAIDDLIRQQAARYRFTVIELTGEEELEDVVGMLRERWAPAEPSPQPISTNQIRAMRQAENMAACQSALLALASIANARPSDLPPVLLNCECGQPTCEEIVPVPAEEALAWTEPRSRFVIAPGHGFEEEAQAPLVGAMVDI